jgi:hypothetical protein
MEADPLDSTGVGRSTDADRPLGRCRCPDADLASVIMTDLHRAPPPARRVDDFDLPSGGADSAVEAAWPSEINGPVRLVPMAISASGNACVQRRRYGL